MIVRKPLERNREMVAKRFGICLLPDESKNKIKPKLMTTFRISFESYFGENFVQFRIFYLHRCPVFVRASVYLSEAADNSLGLMSR